MDTKKMGGFLKQLRKERSMTQEQLAERLNVSSRTVSRWETGSNIPDLDTLIEMADLYGVDIRELIDGERKGENMDAETREILKKVADYTEAEKALLARRMGGMTFAALMIAAGCIALMKFGVIGPDRALQHVPEFVLGVAAAVALMNILQRTGMLAKLRAAKLRFLEKIRKH